MNNNYKNKIQLSVTVKIILNCQKQQYVQNECILITISSKNKFIYKIIIIKKRKIIIVV